ncbi:glycosyltransferase [Desulfospira joergensenii]|uniref:glycosyltransferase n=1 Tax=Desulfospira joergensenii TaxID=53329 RepID=UPI0003B308E2|nr:glycosyltransferase [Desulfospira joergensenii]
MRSLIKRDEKVAIVYHFFAHYRAPVFKELLKNEHLSFVFYGDIKDPGGKGVKPWNNLIGKSYFIQTPTKMLMGKLLFQKGLIQLALNKKIRQIIYLGNPYHILTWISVILARITGKQVFFWTHGWIRQDRGIKKLIRNTFFHLSPTMFLYGQRAKKIGVKNGFKPENLYVIYNSLNYKEHKKLRQNISFKKIESIRNNLFKTGHYPMVVCIGRLITARKLDLLFDASEYLGKAGHKINILIIGDGPERKKLESRARSQKISVNFYGACYNENVLSKLIMAANLVVMPGKIGLTAIHALSYGIPVISHNNPDQQMPEWEAIKPGFNGDVFEQDDFRSLAQVIKKWTRTEFVHESVNRKCFQIVDQYYNPEYQVKIIEKALIEGRQTVFQNPK